MQGHNLIVHNRPTVSLNRFRDLRLGDIEIEMSFSGRNVSISEFIRLFFKKTKISLTNRLPNLTVSVKFWRNFIRAFRLHSEYRTVRYFVLLSMMLSRLKSSKDELFGCGACSAILHKAFPALGGSRETSPSSRLCLCLDFLDQKSLVDVCVFYRFLNTTNDHRQYKSSELWCQNIKDDRQVSIFDNTSWFLTLQNN